jgi:ATP-dependent helicase HrpA
VIVTSATIEPERFAAHFRCARSSRCPAAPIRSRSATAPGSRRRSTIRRPDDPTTSRATELGPTEAIVDASGTGGDPGDVLVFLSGEREIRDTADALRESP